MYRTQTKEQMEVPDFILPFGETLNRQNRWIQLEVETNKNSKRILNFLL